MGFSDEIAIRTIWGEARGEPSQGKLAVAHVLLNRLNDGRWGSTAAMVCLWPSQFSCWAVNDPNRMKICALDDADPALLLCQQAWQQANLFNAPDPTQGAKFYYADSMATPPLWATRMTETAHIGSQHYLIENGAGSVPTN